MANENEKKASEEYQYPEEYYSGEYKPPETLDLEEEPPPSGLRSPRMRRLLLALGLIGAVLVVYGILTYLGRPKSELTGQQAPVAVTPAVTPVPVAPIAVAPPAVSDDVVRTLQQQIRNNQDSIANLQSQLQQMQSNMMQITNAVSTLTNQIQVIANEIKAIASERYIREGMRMLRPETGPTYYLRALVPGRAWLQTLQGRSTTVTIGDKLGSYGIIQGIDTIQGIVTTSSGRLIQYGTKDS